MIFPAPMGQARPVPATRWWKILPFRRPRPTQSTSPHSPPRSPLPPGTKNKYLLKERFHHYLQIISDMTLSYSERYVFCSYPDNTSRASNSPTHVSFRASEAIQTCELILAINTSPRHGLTSTPLNPSSMKLKHKYCNFRVSTEYNI